LGWERTGWDGTGKGKERERERIGEEGMRGTKEVERTYDNAG